MRKKQPDLVPSKRSEGGLTANPKKMKHVKKQIEKHETLAMQDIGEYPQRSRKDLTENDEVREHQDNPL